MRDILIQELKIYNVLNNPKCYSFVLTPFTNYELKQEKKRNKKICKLVLILKQNLH